MIFRTVFVLLVPFLLTSCASYFTRKDCESRNWFDYGYQVAMSGKRLNSDNFLSECRKVEAEIQESQLDLGFKSGMSNYCRPDVVFANGKKGQFFNSEFCDPGQVKLLSSKHREGVQLFCEPGSGFSFGSGGGVYNQICPKEKEDAFLKEYKKGRKKFLAASISENQRRINKIDMDLQSSIVRKSGSENDLRLIEALQIVKPNSVAPNPEDPTEVKKRDLRTKISQQDSEIRNLNSSKSKLQDEIYAMEKESLALD